MVRRPAIHQLVPAFFCGNAISNQAAQIRRLLRGWGYRSQVFAQFRDRRLGDPGLDYRRYSGRPDDVIIYHYSIGSPLTHFAQQLPGRVILYYHNITPPGFLRGYNETLAELLEQGRRELALFRDAPLAWAGSEYNRRELLDLGFRRVEVLPYFIAWDALQSAAAGQIGQKIAAYYGDGAVNILFVGRLVPNKRQDDLIRAFEAYHYLINPRSRLLLVGTRADAPGYHLELETMTTALGLSDHVHLAGSVSLQELGGYYQAADIFLCLSEHEGFCIPLVEAMAFDLPVIAYRSTGVPYAMGGAGVLLRAKRYGLIAELIDLLVRDRDVRQRVLEGQRQRLTRLAPELVEKKLRAYIEQMLERGR